MQAACGMLAAPKSPVLGAPLLSLGWIKPQRHGVPHTGSAACPLGQRYPGRPAPRAGSTKSTPIVADSGGVTDSIA